MARLITAAYASRVVLVIGLGGAAWVGGIAAGPQEQPAPVQEQPDARPVAAAGQEHPEIPDTEGTTCVECHDGIGKKPIVHGAVSAGMCASCHAFTGTGEETRVGLADGVTAETMAGVCVTCHEAVSEAMKAPHAHPALADGNCLTCHAAHDADQANLLNAPQSELCVTCHDAVGVDLKRKTAHPPAAAACGACHDPHGSANATLLREGLNGLCLSCHSASAPPPSQPAKLFGREVSEAVARLIQPGKRVALDALQRRGHPIVGHPVRGPKDPLAADRPLSCVSCHTPHGSDQPALSRFDHPDASAACVKCHK